MRNFVANMVLAFAWAALFGGITLPRLVVGFVLGYILLGSCERLIGDSSYSRKVPQSILFAAYFLAELTRANLRVAGDVLTQAHRSSPGILAVPLEARTPLEVTLLANLLTLTPGSMTLDVDLERRVLYAHVMFAEDPEEARREIHDLERKLLELLR